MLTVQQVRIALAKRLMSEIDIAKYADLQEDINLLAEPGGMEAVVAKYSDMFDDAECKDCKPKHKTVKPSVRTDCAGNPVTVDTNQFPLVRPSKTKSKAIYKCQRRQKAHQLRLKREKRREQPPR